MPDTPHLAFPLRLRGARWLAVEQDSGAHVSDCAEVLLRTRPGMMEANRRLGLRDLVGTSRPIGPEVVDALEAALPAHRFLVDEDESRVAERIRSVLARLDEDEEDEG